MVSAQNASLRHKIWIQVQKYGINPTTKPMDEWNYFFLVEYVSYENVGNSDALATKHTELDVKFVSSHCYLVRDKIDR